MKRRLTPKYLDAHLKSAHCDLLIQLIAWCLVQKVLLKGHG